MVKKILCLVVAVATVYAHAGYFQSWGPEKFIKEWKPTGDKKQCDLVIKQTGNFVLVGVKDKILTPKCLKKTIGFPQNKIGIFEFSIELDSTPAITPFSFTVEFEGGKGCGNYFWNKTVLAGKTAPSKIYRSYINVPEGAWKINLRFHPTEINNVKIEKITVREVTPDMLKKNVVLLTVNKKKVLSSPSALLLGCQVPGIFGGLYRGTLPEDNRLSLRGEFIDFLEKCGIKATRYPGGTESHFFLPEGNEYTIQLLKNLSYGKTVFPRGQLTSWKNYKSTMKQAGVKVIYQLNTSFYLDDNNKIQSICPSKFPKKSKFNDGKDKFGEAGSALERNFKNGLFSPGDVDYWEVGNEEFAYMTVDQYASVCEAFIKVIHKYDPDRPICVTGMKGLEKKLKDKGVYQYVTGITTHYPYASWPRPCPAYETASYKDFSLADVRFSNNLLQKEKQFNKNITVSETSIFNFFTYDFWRILPSYAAALAFAQNWPILMKNPKVDMAVVHDFESPYFGMAKFDVEFSNLERKFTSLDKNFIEPKKTKQGENWFVNPSQGNNKAFFHNQYVDSPAAKVFHLMANFVDGKIYDLNSSGLYLRGMMAGVSPDNHDLLFVCNPFEEPVMLVFNTTWQGKCSCKIIDSDTYSSVLDKEYRVSEKDIELMTYNERPYLIIPPRAVVLLKK